MHLEKGTDHSIFRDLVLLEKKKINCGNQNVQICFKHLAVLDCFVF